MTTLRWRVLAAVEARGTMSAGQVAALVSDHWRRQGRRRKAGTSRWGAGYMEPLVRLGYVLKRATSTSVTFRMTEAGRAALRQELAMPLFDAAGIHDLGYGLPAMHRQDRPGGIAASREAA